MVALSVTPKMLWVVEGGIGLSAIMADTGWLRGLFGQLAILALLLTAYALPRSHATTQEPEAVPEAPDVGEVAATGRRSGRRWRI